MKRVEGLSLEGVYDAYLSTSEDISDMELATLEDWFEMMLKQIKRRRSTNGSNDRSGDTKPKT